MVAGFCFGSDVFETDAHVFIVGSMLDLDGAELLSYGGRSLVVVGEGICKLVSHFLGCFVKNLSAGVGVE